MSIENHFIGVAEVVEDEYDMYIGHIHSLLRTSASEQATAEYLSQFEHEARPEVRLFDSD